MPLSEQAKKRVTVLPGVIDPDYQGEIGLHNEDKEESVWNTGHPSGYLLVLPCLTIKVNGKQQPNLSRTNGPDPSGMKVCVTPSGKEPRQAEVLAEGKGNTRWVVEEDMTSYNHVTSYRNKDCHCHEYLS